jgi:hypothetical protein
MIPSFFCSQGRTRSVSRIERSSFDFAQECQSCEQVGSSNLLFSLNNVFVCFIPQVRQFIRQAFKLCVESDISYK